MEGESGGVGRGEKMYFVAPGVGIDSLGGFLRSKCAYTRTCDFRDGGPVFFFLFFFFYTTHGSWGSTRGRRKHLVLRKKKKNDGEGGGAGLEGERREGFTVPGVAQILRQRNTRERLR